MYLEHFRLATSPFGISPRLDFLYKSSSFEESIAHLVYGLDNSEAIVMITGAIGTGKTMAVQSFLSCLGDRYITALVTNTQVDGKELLKLILEDLDIDLPPGGDKSDLLIAFKQLLMTVGRDGRRILIIIDEAQNLDLQVLEEIRLLTNLGQGDLQPVQIILVGQPELEAKVARPDLAQLRQRIRVHYKLAPLSGQEVREYIDHRLAVAGALPGIFPTEASARVHELSHGVPRVVNSLCDQALVAAFVAGRRQVKPEDVDDAAASVGVAGETMPARPAEDPGQPVSVTARPPVSAFVAPPPSGAPVSQDMATRRAVEPRREPPAPVPARAQRRSKSSGGAGRARGARKARAIWTLVAIVVLAVAAVGITGAWKPLAERFGYGAKTQPDGVRIPADEVHVPAVQSAPALSVAAADSTVAAGPDSMTMARSEVAAVGDSMHAPVEAPAEGSIPVAAAPAMGQADPQPTPAQVVTENVAEQVEPSWLHVSSFRTASHADAVAQGFIAGGVGASVHQQTVRGEVWYRVYLGPYPSHGEAVRAANALRDSGKVTYYKVISAGQGEGS